MQKWMVILSLFLSVVSEAQERRFVLWNKNDVDIHPWEKVTINVAEKIHYSPKNKTIESSYGELMVKHKPGKWFDYGGGLRISYLNIAGGNWLNENRPMLFFNLTKNINKYKLDFSNRFEYRTFKEINDYFRVRQELKITFPALTRWGMRFYLSGESFMKFNNEGIHLTRFFTGLSALEKERFKMKLYYSLEKARIANVWSAADIVGINLGFSI